MIHNVSTDSERHTIRGYLNGTMNDKDAIFERFRFPEDPDPDRIRSRSDDKRIEKLMPLEKERMREQQRKNRKVEEQITAIYRGYNESTVRMHNYLAVFRQSLQGVFYYAASSQYNKHYALNKQGVSAIPADNGRVEWDSLFGSSLERLYFTAFLFMNTGVPRDTEIETRYGKDRCCIKRDLNSFTWRARAELANTDALSSDDVLADSDLIREYRARYEQPTGNLPTSGFDDMKIDEMVEWVNQDPTRYHRLNCVDYQEPYETNVHTIPLILDVCNLFSLVVRDLGRCASCETLFLSSKTCTGRRLRAPPTCSRCWQRLAEG